MAGMINIDIKYLITPFFAWLVAGGLKFLINSVRSKTLAFHQVGYGGFPSNHSAIVTSMVVLIALNEGIHTAAFGIALTLAFIVMMDANSLRQQIGKQAQVINQLAKQQGSIGIAPLRERMGHTKIEIAGGVLVGLVVAIVASNF